jgi:hypothetical protein
MLLWLLTSASRLLRSRRENGAIETISNQTELATRINPVRLGERSDGLGSAMGAGAIFYGSDFAVLVPLKAAGIGRRAPGAAACFGMNSMAPRRPDKNTYIVLDDFGTRLGWVRRATNENSSDREIQRLIAGAFSNPIRIVAFNAFKGWSRDVTVNIADEVRRRVHA